MGARKPRRPSVASVPGTTASRTAPASGPAPEHPAVEQHPGEQPPEPDSGQPDTGAAAAPETISATREVPGDVALPSRGSGTVAASATTGRPSTTGQPSGPDSPEKKAGRSPKRGRSRKKAAEDSSAAAGGKDSTGTADSGTDTISATVLPFPEPPRRRRRRNAILGSVTAVLLTGLFLAFLYFSPALALKTIRVEGNSLLAPGIAEEALEPLKGRSLATLSDDEVAALLADRPEIESVDMAAEPPSTIVVIITERIPVAVLQSNGAFLLIDAQGRELATVADRAAAKLPLIDGGAQAVNSQVFPALTSVLAALPEDVLSQLEHASARTVDSVELKLTNGQTVFWGSAEANAAKARVLEALLRMAPTDPPVKVYDISTPDFPVTRS